MALSRQQSLFIGAAVRHGTVVLNRRKYADRSAWSVGSEGFRAVVGDNLERLGIIKPLREHEPQGAVLMTEDGSGVLYGLTEHGMRVGVQVMRRPACDDDDDLALIMPRPDENSRNRRAAITSPSPDRPAAATRGRA